MGTSLSEPPQRFFGWGSWRASADWDFGVRGACVGMNQSGWVWTVESCEGHGDAEWPDPMIRFVCKAEHLGRLVWLLQRAKRSTPGAEEAWVEMHPGYDTERDWSTVLTYVRGRAPLSVRRAIYETFATYVCEERPVHDAGAGAASDWVGSGGIA